MIARTTSTLPFHVCRVTTRNQKSHTHCTQTIPHGMNNMKVFLKIHMPRFEPPNTCFGHLIPFIAISTLASASATVRSVCCFFPFWPPNANGRICPQVRSTLSELRQGVLMAPTGMRDDGSDGATAQLVILCMEYWDKWRHDVLLEVRDGRIQR